MPSVIGRIIVKVRALLPQDWMGAAGRQFKKTVTLLARDIPPLMAEGIKRFAVGKVSREHAEALKNYAEEERARSEAELARRTLVARERQERAKADQEEIKVRLMRTQELMERLKLFNELQKHNALPVMDKQGNIQIVKAPASFDWEELRALLLKGEIVLSVLEPAEDEEDEEDK